MDHNWIDFIMWIIQSKFDARQCQWRWWMDAYAHTVGSLFIYLFFSFPCRPFLLELQNVNDQIDFSNEMDTIYSKLIRFKNTHIETKSTKWYGMFLRLLRHSFYSTKKKLYKLTILSMALFVCCSCFFTLWSNVCLEKIE